MRALKLAVLYFALVFGVGFALNAVSVLGPDASTLLAIVVVGTIGSEVAAVLLSPRSVNE